MKIKFVEGERVGKSGASAIWSDVNNAYVRGYFEVVRVSEYNVVQTRRVTKRIKKKIVIVKQKSWWRMFRTLVHELFHWFIFTFVTQEDNKYDKWIDRK